ncbi:MAG TPA: glycosyltransferase family 2 protein [Saprospiraceae bacterium]|nr:glycosyltransferase family 2 protein [Saprospiraceae bacterium]
MSTTAEKISLVVITYNEAQNIARCLDSARAVVDEMLVVDSFSEDDTVAIAERKGARVLQHAFAGYIEQKRYAIEQARYERVLLLDADEALDEQLQNSIQTVRGDWTHACYTMNRMSTLGDRWIRYGAWYPDRKMRLFERRQYQIVGINPHDKFVPRPGVAPLHLRGDILHYTNDGLEDRIATINKFSTVAAAAFAKKGKRGHLLRVLFKPGLRFFAEFVLKRGFLDGFYGYFIAKTSAQYVFLREVKLLELQRKSQKEASP